MGLFSPSGKRNRLLLLFLVCFFTWLTGYSAAAGAPVNYSVTVVNSYPHDLRAFTQGLVWDDGNIYEGTGLYGSSSLRRVDLQTGRVIREHRYARQIFAEGVTVLQDKIYQLTWKNNLVFVYDKHTFSLIDSFPFPLEGWGITHDGRHLIVSDGSAELYFLEPETLTEKRRITVHDQSGPVRSLNELEYVRGSIYANIWQSDRIALINPEDGCIEGWLDLTGLPGRPHDGQRKKVLNGIMYVPEDDRLFITGKLWPKIYEIILKPEN